MKALAIRLFLCGASLWLAGCATDGPATAPTAETAAEAGADTGPPTDAQTAPELYLQASPQRRLYVEVAAVAGCAPSNRTLDRLRDFLSTYCDKPEGIELVRSPEISRAEARGLPPRALARIFMKGPPEVAGTPAPAYLYILYYDSDLTQKSHTQGTNHWGASTHALNLHPHADLWPYPAIYMNVRYGFQKWVPNEMLLHEAGHILGLVSRPDFATNHHCLSPQCFMNSTIRVSLHRAFLGEPATKQMQLCGRCMTELVRRLKGPARTNVYFAGPVLVRTERGYAVLSLPHRVALIVGTLTPQDCRDFAAQTQAEAARPDDDEFRYRGVAKDDMLAEPQRLRAALEQAEQDSQPNIRRLAGEIWQKVQSHPAGEPGKT